GVDPERDAGIILESSHHVARLAEALRVKRILHADGHLPEAIANCAAAAGAVEQLVFVKDILIIRIIFGDEIVILALLIDERLQRAAGIHQEPGRAGSGDKVGNAVLAAAEANGMISVEKILPVETRGVEAT